MILNKIDKLHLFKESSIFIDETDENYNINLCLKADKKFVINYGFED
jgi:hypothetical protein